jgi:hypothetical protein
MVVIQVEIGKNTIEEYNRRCVIGWRF